MFSKTIIDSDIFLDMPLSTQSLYFHLAMRADDEGFINNPKKIQRMIGASEDDIRILIGKNFIIPFESGIVVIKHWRIHNYIQSDRFKVTLHTEEKAQLSVDENKEYVLSTECIQDVYNMDTQISIDKISIDKNKHIIAQNDNTEVVDVVPVIDVIEEFFNKVWLLYPRKVGKSSVSKSKKKELYKVGYEKLSMAIEIFKKEMSGREQQYIPYGSTFFNTLYKDYVEQLDDSKIEVVEDSDDGEWQ